MNFTNFKDRIWKLYSFVARIGMALPGRLARASFGGITFLMWLVWALPFTPVRQAFRDLAAQCNAGSATGIFRRYARSFSLLLYRMECIRYGRTAEIGALLDIPERDRFDDIVARGGAIFLMPHAHGSVTMAEALGQIHPLLLFVRATKDDDRAAFQREYYDQMTCDVIDVRRADDVVSSRKMLSALRKGHIILGGGDFIRRAPKTDENIAKDVVRVQAFGEPVGAMRWPARFAAKTGVPIVPVNIVDSGTQLTLHMGEEIAPGDIVETTQKWMDGMVELIKQYPDQWVFCLDRHWRRVLEKAKTVDETS
ncbi:hypothetical protein [uncultured Pelagimonas sp.]|uniref:LpxL/LpxP family acyltransferase n=2 Tax=uncultured Pelagimonas sp. TaxID=1618102 RepID=UPI0026274467|nr:hypothetical protein [uncultured Pelagimonas sp.]